MYNIQDKDNLHYTINDIDVFETMFKRHKNIIISNTIYENIISLKIHPFLDKIVLANGEPGKQIVIPIIINNSISIINNKETFIINIK